jgi:hypothetical protein
MLVLLLAEFGIMKMVGIFVDGDLHASPSVQRDKLVVDEDMPIVAPVGATPAFRLGVEDPKFKWHFAGIDPQELFREIAGGFVCHDVSFCKETYPDCQMQAGKGC